MDETKKRGIFLGAEPLHPTATATTIRMENGKPLILDGPFAETKEQLAGYYILDCADLDEAIGWLQRSRRRAKAATGASKSARSWGCRRGKSRSRGCFVAPLLAMTWPGSSLRAHGSGRRPARGQAPRSNLAAIELHVEGPDLERFISDQTLSLPVRMPQRADIRAAAEAVFRREHGRIIAGLIRRCRSFDRAEEAMQEAFAAALAAWAGSDIPQIRRRGSRPPRGAS